MLQPPRRGVRLAGLLAWTAAALVLGSPGFAFVDINVPADFPTIQQAIDNASHGDTIIVSEGVWIENLTVPPSLEITIRSTNPNDSAVVNNTIIDGAGTGSTITCNSTLTGAPFHLYGVTITGGSAVDGGGIFANNRLLDIQLCVFTNNLATGDGGAIFVSGTGASSGEGVSVSKSVFKPNTGGHGNQANNNGGAVFVLNTTAEFVDCRFVANVATVTGGALEIAELDDPHGLNDLTAIVLRCTFISNSAATGGAINSTQSGIDLDGCTFLSNEAPFGGAIEIDRNFLAELTDCFFAFNAAEFDGGAVETSESALFIDDSHFEDNSAAFGGAVEFSNSTDVMLTKCSFLRNRASGGGAIMQEGQWSGTMAIRKCAFVENDATGIDQSQGGAIVAFNIHLANCDFDSNRTTDTSPWISAYGGAINLWGSTRMVNCRFRNNSADRGSAVNVFGDQHIDIVNCTFSQNEVLMNGQGTISCSSGISQIANCVVWGNNDGIQSFLGTTTVEYCDVQGGYVGTGNFDLDPLFVDPAAGDFRLQAGSPCIGTGYDLRVPEDYNDLDGDGDISEFTPFDLDELPRFQANVDMGAYERQ